MIITLLILIFLAVVFPELMKEIFMVVFNIALVVIPITLLLALVGGLIVFLSS